MQISRIARLYSINWLTQYDYKINRVLSKYILEFLQKKIKDRYRYLLESEKEYLVEQGYPECLQFHPPFKHGVSILDLMFHVGPEALDYIWEWRD